MGVAVRTLSVAVQPKSSGAAMRLHILVVDQDGHVLYAREDTEFYHCSIGRFGGWPDMVALGSVTGAKIYLLCRLEYFPSKYPVMADKLKIKSGSDFTNMFESAIFADVTFLVQDEEIPAHKSVLASRSTYRIHQ